MQPAKMSPVRQKLELVTEEHCSCCRDALASAAHELKTPLAIMGGYLHLLLTEKLGPLSPRQIEVLTEMQANGVRLSNFIQNLLTYTSLKVDRFEMHYEVGDINACIREIAEVWAQRFQDKAIAFYFLPNEKLEPFPFDYYKSAARGFEPARQCHEVHAVVGHGLAARRALFLGAAHGAAAASGGAPQGAGHRPQLLPHFGLRHRARESPLSSSKKSSKSTSA